MRLAFASAPRLPLNLAKYLDSPVHSSIGTPSRAYGAPTACGHTVSGSFHSAPAVLFTFPSRYFLYRSFSSVSPWMVVHPASHWVPRAPWYSGSRPARISFRYEGLTLFAAFSQMLPLEILRFLSVRNPGSPKTPGLGSSLFARRYLGILMLIPLPPVT